jgi:hypothetical protein
MKRFWTFILGGAVMLSAAAPAMAKDHGRDHHPARQWNERRDHRDPYRRTHWGDHERNSHPGWDKGRKTGWRGGSLPPGQAKKHRDHERERWAREHRHHRRHTSTYARGPIVTPRTNYPTRAYPTRTYPTVRQPQYGHGPIPVPNVGQQTTAQKPSGQGGPIPVPR